MLQNLRNFFKKRINSFGYQTIGMEYITLERYLKQDDYWNPNANPQVTPVLPFDVAYPQKALLKFISENCTDISGYEGMENSGEIIYTGIYNDYQIKINFSLHNARLLNLSMCFKIDLEDHPIELLLDELNKINASDYLISASIDSTEQEYFCLLSTIIIITDIYGDVQTFINSFNHLIELAKSILNKINDVDKILKLFQAPKPSDVSDIEELDRGENESALSMWFGIHTNSVYGDVHEIKDDKLIRSIPFPLSLNRNRISVAISNSPSAIIFTGPEIFNVKLKVTKNNPLLYAIEAKNIIKIFSEDSSFKSLKLSLDEIKSLCNMVNLRMHNLLFKCFWVENEGKIDILLIAYGLHYQRVNMWAKIDIIGEYLKNLAFLKSMVSAD